MIWTEYLLWEPANADICLITLRLRFCHSCFTSYSHLMQLSQHFFIVHKFTIRNIAIKWTIFNLNQSYHIYLIYPSLIAQYLSVISQSSRTHTLVVSSHFAAFLKSSQVNFFLRMYENVWGCLSKSEEEDVCECPMLSEDVLGNLMMSEEI